ncbi:hypothetical protein ACOMHN_038246 [Nucella lapillus]
MASLYVQRTDGHGNTFYCSDLEGMPFPPFPSIPDARQHMRDIRDMELSPHDVMIAGFPKSGSHWITSVVHMLMTGQTDSYFKTEIGAILDRTPLMGDATPIPPPSPNPRLFYTHVKFSFLPSQVVEKKVKLICLQRNPQDTWVSLYSHLKQHAGVMAYDGTWEHFFDLMMSPDGLWYGNWFDYALDWERDIARETARGLPVFVNAFEDMKRDPVGQTEKLDQFLGYNRGRELCEQIAKACEFSALKAAKDGEWQKEKGLFKENTTGCYRKGEVGDWKNWFTVAQREKFDQEFKARMLSSKLRFTFL